MSFASNGIITSPYKSKVDGKIIGIWYTLTDADAQLNPQVSLLWTL